jgi:hypothetical protein
MVCRFGSAPGGFTTIRDLGNSGRCSDPLLTVDSMYDKASPNRSAQQAHDHEQLFFFRSLRDFYKLHVITLDLRLIDQIKYVTNVLWASDMFSYTIT